MQSRVQGWVLSAPTDTIHSGPVPLCWAQTSGPVGCVPGHRARVPSAAASALGRALQPASSCSSILIPAREIIYLLRNVFSQETSPVLRDIFSYKEQINSWSLGGSANTGAKPRAGVGSCAGSALQHGGVPATHPTARQRPVGTRVGTPEGDRATQPAGTRGTCCVVPTETLGFSGECMALSWGFLPLASGDQQGWSVHSALTAVASARELGQPLGMADKVGTSTDHQSS